MYDPLPCPFCENSVTVTAAGEFRVHGPTKDRCEGSGTTPVEFPKEPEQAPTTILGTLAEVLPKPWVEDDRVPEGHVYVLPSSFDVVVSSDGQTQTSNGHTDVTPELVTKGDRKEPPSQSSLHPEVGIPVPQAPSPTTQSVLAPPTPEISAERQTAIKERQALADAQVKARRAPAVPAWTGKQRLDSLGADVYLGKREAIAAAINLVKLQVPLACDIETEGLDEAARHIKCVIFSESPGGRSAVILDPRDPDQALVVTWIFDNVPELIFHSSPYDVPQLVINSMFRPEHAAKVTDTLLYARGAEPDNNVSKSLGACCERYLHIAYDAQGLQTAGKAAGMRSKEEIFREMDLDRPVYARGAATDAIVTARLAPILRRAYYDRLTSGHPFGEWGVTGTEAVDLVEREQKLNRMSLRRTAKGFRVDLEYLDRFNAQHAGKIEKAAAALEKYDIRPGNANDLTAWLGNHNFIPQGYPRTPKSDALSGKKEHLEMLGHPLAGVFRWHKEQTHVLHDYLEKVRDLAVERNGDMFIYPVINYFGATTGRMSVGGPPLQQFPGPARGIIFAPTGDNFTSIDWSQIEPVVIANVSGELDVLHGYENEGKKFYTVVSDLTGIPYKQAKTQLLGTLYGQGLKLTAAKLGVDVDRAREIKDAIFAPMPKVLQMTHTLRDIAREHQMIPTISGRIIPIPSGYYEDRWSVQTHKGVNYHVQGSAYDVLADRSLEVEDQGLGDAIHLLMHDELIVSTDAAHDIRKIMETPPERLIKHSGRTPILHTDTADLGERWAVA